MQSRIRHSPINGVFSNIRKPFSWSSWWATRYISALSVVTTSDTTQIITATIVGTGYDGVSYEYSTDGINYTEKGVAVGGTYNATGLTADTLYYWRARLYKGTHFGDYSNVNYDTTFITQYSTVYNALITKPSKFIASAQNIMLKTIVNAGLFPAKIVRFYVFAQSINTANEALIDWINPTRLAVLSPTQPAFTSLEGFKMNGISSFIDLNFIPSTEGGSIYTQDSAGISFYSKESDITAGYDVGAYDGVKYSQIASRHAADTTYISLNGAGATIANVAKNASGLYIFNRSASNALQVYNNKHGMNITSQTTVSTTMVSRTLYLGARNNAGTADLFTTKQYSFCILHGSLTPNEILVLNDAIEIYMQTISGRLKLADLPIGISQHGFESCNGKLYAIGGYLSKKVYEYDPSTNIWSAKTDLPTASLGIQSPILRSVNNKLYFIGGFVNGSPEDVNTVYEYDPSLDSWATKTPMPTKREDFGSAVYNNKIYCFGGLIFTTPTNIMEVYDPSTDSWDETKADLPIAKWSGDFGCACNGKIYAVGSTDIYAGYPTLVPVTTIYEYDLVADSWSAKNAIPISTCYKEIEVIGTKIYVMSGAGAGSTNLPTNLSSRIYEYDVIGDSWVEKYGVPYGSIGSALTVLNNIIYMCGGEDNAYAGTSRKDLWRFDVI